MSGSVHCCFCSKLPTRPLGHASRVERCHLCRNEVGVSLDGDSFRIAAGSPVSLSHLLVLGAFGMFGLFLVGTAATMMLVSAKPRPTEVRAVESPTKNSQPIEEAWLQQVAEVGLRPVMTKLELAREYSSAKQRHEKGSDAFLDEIVLERPELAGLPFLRGDACKLDPACAEELGKNASEFRGREAIGSPAGSSVPGVPDLIIYDVFHERAYVAGPHRVLNSEQSKVAAVLPAAMQILAVQAPEFRGSMARALREFPAGDDASISALVRLAIFDADPEVRFHAIQSLQREPVEKYGPKLLEGIRYPWSAVADRAADAIVKLQRIDLLPKLVEHLDEPDPAAPFERDEAGKKTWVVRELVRINHHRNCLLCHPPSPREDARELPGMIASVPAPDEALPPMNARVYYFGNSDAPTVRANETYLRQDFSVMQTVPNPGKWPERQRFDFFVRTRVLTPEQIAQMKQAVRPTNEIPSANHRAALNALTRLTGTYAGPKSSDWIHIVAR